MLSDKIKLTAKDILEKDFKTAMRGYKPEDVDQFLDLIIKDYEVFHQEIEDLRQENIKLKKQAESQHAQTVQPAPNELLEQRTLIFLNDCLTLEKHVFGSKLFD